MKKFNINLLFLLALAIFFTSCSKDEDENPEPEVNLANVEFVRPGTTFDIVRPDKFYNSSSPKKNEVSTLASYGIIYSSLAGSFTIPPGTKPSNTPINAGGNRVAQANVLVYEYDYGSGYRIAYQLTELADGYRWEYFIKTPEMPSYIKYVEGQQNKAGNEGSYKVYSAYAENDWDNSYAAFSGSWQWNANESDYQYNFDYLDSEGVIRVRADGGFMGDGSGYTNWLDAENNTRSEVIWNADGSGSWKELKNNVITNQGSWTN